jgi:rhodanese-related sulfurtransferase
MVTEISATELHRFLDDPDTAVLVVDLREPVEYEIDHIPGSTNVPMGSFTAELPELDLDTDVIVTACPVGVLSVQAARLLEAYEGTDEETTIGSLDGGYAEYSTD